MNNGWTGGQYSAFRCLFGLYLFIHFVFIVPWAPEIISNRGALPDGSASPLLFLFPNILAVYDPPWFTILFVALAAVAAVFFGLGTCDRPAALLMWYVLACIYGRNPLTLNPSLPFVGWILLAHVFLPPAPYGSLKAVGRTDPSAGWRMPRLMFAAAWIVMAIGYSYSGYAKLGSPSWTDGTALHDVLDNPLARPTWIRTLLLSLPDAFLHLATWTSLCLELAFAPLALFRRLRPWLWLAMILLHLGILVTIDFADLTVGMLVLHAFTFNPAWIQPSKASKPETIYFDGTCGLCQRSIRFVIAEDPSGAFQFSPLQGEHFAKTLPATVRQSLPDSLIVLTESGELLSKYKAVAHVLDRFGGVWRPLGSLIALTPTWLGNSAYDWVARHRLQWFQRPKELCPLMPPHLRQRFLA